MKRSSGLNRTLADLSTEGTGHLSCCPSACHSRLPPETLTKCFQKKHNPFFLFTNKPLSSVLAHHNIQLVFLLLFFGQEWWIWWWQQQLNTKACSQEGNNPPTPSTDKNWCWDRHWPPPPPPPLPHLLTRTGVGTDTDPPPHLLTRTGVGTDIDPPPPPPPPPNPLTRTGVGTDTEPPIYWQELV